MRQASLVRFCVVHALCGIGVAVGLIGLMLAFDVANLRTLVFSNDVVGFAALAIMTVFFSITFGSVQIGIALMTRTWEEDDNPPRNKPLLTLPEPQLGLAPVPARARRR